jgi:mRNA interferase MazF
LCRYEPNYGALSALSPKIKKNRVFQGASIPKKQKKEKKLNIITRGDVYYADLPDGQGSEQQGCRPIVVLQNNVGNKNSPTVVVAAITSKICKNNMPTHIEIVGYLPQKSVVLLEQIFTLDKHRIKNYIATLDENLMTQINNGLRVSLSY